MKANEKLEEKYEKGSLNRKYKNLVSNGEIGLILYEGMLIKLERDIWNHIKIREIIFCIFFILYIERTTIKAKEWKTNIWDRRLKELLILKIVFIAKLAQKKIKNIMIKKI